jgi:hypothetical protein
MNNNIFEELPARKSAPAAAAPAGGAKGKEGKGPNDPKANAEKRIRQAVYDIRYRARREGVDIKQAFSQYMQNSSLNPQERTAVKAKVFPKGAGAVKEDFQIEELATDTITSAFTKVFFEGVEKEVAPIQLDYLEELNALEDRKYKVRVSDKNSGRSYVRYATREKISQLRANPNISSVEMTEYGEPYEGEKNKGEQTAKTKAGKDYDGDGKVESGAKEHAGSVHNAIQRKKGGTADGKDTSSVKEEFLGEVKDKDENNRKLKPMGPGETNKVIINPPSSIVSHHKLEGDVIVEKAPPGAKFERMVKHIKAGYAKGGVTDKEKSIAYATAWKAKNKETQKEETECSTEPKKKGEKQVDPRSIPTTTSLIKNKLRAMGMRNPMVMVTNEETVEEGAGLSVGISKIAGQLNANPRTSAEQGAKSFQKNVTDPIGNAVKGAVRAVVQPANMSPEAQKARTNKYRPEGVQLNGKLVDESTADDALAIMRKRIADRHGAKALIGSDENKKDTEERKAEAEKQPKPKRKLKGYSIPGAPKEKSYND